MKNNKKQFIIVGLIIILSVFLVYKLSHINFKTFKTFKTNKINEPKIAFLFLTYNNLKRPDIWNKFFCIETDIPSKYSNKYSIYNHAKEKDKVIDILLKDRHNPEHIETCWGCFGTVEANILMMKEALKDPLNNKFILVSDSCIPIVSFDKLYNKIMKDDKSRFKMWDENNTPYRYNDIIQPEFSNKNFIKHNGQGIILNRNHTELLVNSLFTYKDNWKNMGCVDEHYFGNILKILDPNFNINNNSKNSMFNSWFKDELNLTKICNNENEDETICKPHYKGTNSPSIFKKISNKTIDEIRNKDFLFIRKVDKDTKIDIDYITY